MKSVIRRPLGVAVLGLSAAGFPLTEIVIGRWGRRGAAVVEAVCAGLMVRDAAMIAAGAPQRLRPIPAALLWGELATATIAAITGLSLLAPEAQRRSETPQSRIIDVTRRAAVGLLFGLHTIRFGIYLQPNRGLRHPPHDTAAVA